MAIKANYVNVNDYFSNVKKNKKVKFGGGNALVLFGMVSDTGVG